MSHLVRFETKDMKIRSRIFEQASRKHICMCCGQKKFGILVRHLSSNKRPDTSICSECIVLISLGIPIEVNRITKFGSFSPINIVKEAKRRAKKPAGQPKGSKMPNVPTEKCKVCNRMITTKGGMKRHMQEAHSKAKK